MIDMHMHSTASDGTDNIKELLEKVREAGITVFSVTDHDTIDGSLEMERIVPDDMEFIKGIEFSSITEAGKCHILAYDYDENDKLFQSMLEEGFTRRRNKMERRIAFLDSEFGIRLTEDELSHLRQMKSGGKPHLGNLLVAKGYAADKNAAIEKYLDPCKTESDRLDGSKVIKAILSSGGIPVWAHPFGGSEEKAVSIPTFEKQLRILMKAGLKGLECHYSKYTDEQVEYLTHSADINGLYISGGSDYHGTNKKVPLGKLNATGSNADREKITILKAIEDRHLTK
ncbi:MAG: PHP domain-containing protein [Lachnospiraceae bacterium]|nr:PHP domain-containing protein [Lachnospiraceae bacterium]